jgi:hypothetical protein
MYLDESELAQALRSAEMTMDPDPANIAAVRQRMETIALRRNVHRRRARVAWIVGLLLCGAGGATVAATEAGREFIRSLFTTVTPRHEMTVTTPDATTWSRGGSTEPYTPAQKRVAVAQFNEIAALSQAGLGELVGLMEGPEDTVYQVRYALADGSFVTVATGELSELQALMIRIDEVARLRDAGAGDVIVESSSPIGLGFYVIRFQLSDGMIDLETYYPPAPRSERDAIFAETRRLKAELQFTVDQASINVENPEEGIFGTLRYTLADRRTVGIVERVPAEVISADGTRVVVPTIGDQPQERDALREAGGGKLVGLLERPGWDGQLSTTTYRVTYTLTGGETTTVGQGALSPAQRAAMRIDEIQQLRDAGAGEIVSEGEALLGLGAFTIRFTLADGETVDLRTTYPPGTRQEREAIFAETRQLKALRRFSVETPQVLPAAGVGAVLVYTLSDGRTVRHFEQVPTELISSDGTRIVLPHTGESVEITRSQP